MIKRSILVAIAAVLMSLLIHSLGLIFTSGDVQTQSGQENSLDVTDVGSAFEDFTEALAEPAAPEITPPEPAVDTTPTSQALVASDNPQNVTTPDTGSSEVIEADSPEPSGGAGETITDVEPAQTIVDVPDPAEPESDPAPVQSEVAEAAPEQADAAPTEAVSALEPDITIASLPDEPEILTADEAENGSASAVSRSLRPPTERPTAEALGVPDRTEQPRVAAGIIESPLTAYKRSGVDLLGGSRSGTTGFSGSRSAGNASATNYAGQILTRLNRAPIVYASARGMARVSFQINPDGSLAWIRILRSTGTGDIERAARAQVQSAAPFPRPPDGTSRRLVFNYRNR